MLELRKREVKPVSFSPYVLNVDTALATSISAEEQDDIIVEDDDGAYNVTDVNVEYSDTAIEEAHDEINIANDMVVNGNVEDGVVGGGTTATHIHIVDEADPLLMDHRMVDSVHGTSNIDACIDLDRVKFEVEEFEDNGYDEDYVQPSMKKQHKKRDYKGFAKGSQQSTQLVTNKPYKCSECSKAYETERELVGHVDRVHTSPDTRKKLVRCDVCDKLVMRKGLFAHKERLHGQKNFSCLFCTYKAESRMQIVRHTDEHHEKLSVECPVCGRDVFNLEQHMARHQKQKYGCSMCDFKIGIKAQVEAHFRREHLEDSNCTLPDNYCRYLKPSPSHFKVTKCPHCDYKSNNNGNVKKHIKTVHESLKEKCDICGGLYKSAHAHKRSVHDKVRNFPCPYCDYKSLNNYQLTNHIKVKHTDIDERLKCKICGKKVKNLDRHHELNHSSDPSIKAPKFFCEDCPYKTHDKSAFSAHIKATHIRERVPCPVCHKMVIQCKLSGHMKCHRNNRFSCVPCARTFRERRDLGKHILYQHRHHRHRCEYCRKNDVTDYLAHVKYNHKEVDWKNIVVPTFDKTIISFLVRLLEEQFVYMGAPDSIETKLKIVLNFLEEKGSLTRKDINSLGFSCTLEELDSSNETSSISNNICTDMSGSKSINDYRVDTGVVTSSNSCDVVGASNTIGDLDMGIKLEVEEMGSNLIDSS